MPIFTWLHLSDWHQGSDSNASDVHDRGVVLEALLRDIENRVSIDKTLQRIDVVIFSGDIAWSGKANEFNEARSNFLERVLKVTGCSKENLFIVPGNHDLNRDDFELLPSTLKAPFVSSQKAHEWLSDERKRTEVLKIFSNYRTFVSDFTRQASSDFLSFKEILVGQYSVALLGLNSALMCGRNEINDPKGTDYGFLTIGEPQIIDARGKTESHRLRICVVHHPFDWLTSDDRDFVKFPLMRHCDFILCGHQHQQQVDIINSSQGDSVIIPAGASYNRRFAGNQRYVNAYNFVAVDIDAGDFSVYLRTWDEVDNRWREDVHQKNGVFSGKIAKLNDEPIVHSKSSSQWSPWSNITREFLTSSRYSIADQQLLDFFDGSHPSWSEVLSPAIESRACVERILSRIDQAYLTRKPSTVLLTGAVGEGKSTALKQVVCQVVERNMPWQVWFYDPLMGALSLDSNNPVGAGLSIDKNHFVEFLNSLRIAEHFKWLIVVDEAAFAIRELTRALVLLKERADICLLLCARDADWKNAGVDETLWKQLTNYSKEVIEGLDKEDALHIVRAWHRYGEKGLGKSLYQLSRKDPSLKKVAEKLVSKSRGYKGNSRGAFLGAMLALRYASGLVTHVEDMLNRLSKEVVIAGKTLRDIFIYIAAIDAIQSVAHQPVLQIDILARTLGCDPQALLNLLPRFGQEVPPLFDRLAKEIHTRHPLIAEAAIEVEVKRTSPEAISEIYIGLAKSAIELFKDIRNEKTTVSYTLRANMAKWNYLSAYFFEVHEPPDRDLGILLAEAVYKVEDDDLHLLVTLARLLREYDTQPTVAGGRTRIPKNQDVREKVFPHLQQALDLFIHDMEKYPGLKDRGYYYEWATCCGQSGDHFADVLLSALSLSDGIPGEMNKDRLQASLPGLAIAFSHLNGIHRAKEFLTASVVATWFALSLIDNISASAKRQLEILWDQNSRAVRFDPNITIAVALDHLRQGVTKASQYYQDKMHKSLPATTTLQFQDLQRELEAYKK